MKLWKKVNFIIYWFCEQGFEIFLVNVDEKGIKWDLFQGVMDNDKFCIFIEEDCLIELDLVVQDSGDLENVVVVEGDWYEILLLKFMFLEDVQYFKDKIKSVEKGIYFVLKEAVKKVMFY